MPSHVLPVGLMACHFMAFAQALPLPTADLPSVLDIGHYLKAVMSQPETVESASQTLPIFWNYNMDDDLDGSALDMRKRAVEVAGYLLIFLIASYVLWMIFQFTRSVLGYKR